MSLRPTSSSLISAPAHVDQFTSTSTPAHGDTSDQVTPTVQHKACMSCRQKKKGCPHVNENARKRNVPGVVCVRCKILKKTCVGVPCRRCWDAGESCQPQPDRRLSKKIQLVGQRSRSRSKSLEIITARQPSPQRASQSTAGPSRMTFIETIPVDTVQTGTNGETTSHPMPTHLAALSPSTQLIVYNATHAARPPTDGATFALCARCKTPRQTSNSLLCTRCQVDDSLSLASRNHRALSNQLAVSPLARPVAEQLRVVTPLEKTQRQAFCSKIRFTLQSISSAVLAICTERLLPRIVSDIVEDLTQGSFAAAFTLHVMQSKWLQPELDTRFIIAASDDAAREVLDIVCRLGTFLERARVLRSHPTIEDDVKAFLGILQEIQDEFQIKVCSGCSQALSEFFEFNWEPLRVCKDTIKGFMIWRTLVWYDCICLHELCIGAHHADITNFSVKVTDIADIIFFGYRIYDPHSID